MAVGMLKSFEGKEEPVPWWKKTEDKQEKAPDTKNIDSTPISQQEILRDPEYKAIEDSFVKKGFTRRGMRELISITRQLYKNRKEAIRTAEKILLGLSGTDGFSVILKTLKLATEGLGSILKGRPKQIEK